MGLKPMLIFVLDEGGVPGHPDQGLPGQPPGIWPSPGHPAHPIAPGGQPPGIWPSPGHPSHPIAPGGQPGAPDNSLPPLQPGVGIPVFPTHPIAPGGSGGGGEVPTHPIELPELPKGAFVIVWVPGQGYVAVPVKPGRPDQGLPQPPTAQPKR
jgi:hypothetical protein